MKKILSVLIAGSLTAASHAGIEIPRNIYKVDQLEAASAEAGKEKKGLAFVMTDPGTSCGLCIDASDKAFKSLKSHSVIVFGRSRGKNHFTSAASWDSMTKEVCA